jgi:predicted nucleic acid-binding protein
MPDNSRVLYWDSSVFLSWVNETPSRAPIIEDIHAEITKGNNSIVYTSVESIVEVANADSEKQQQKLDPAVEERINNMWEDISFIKVVDNIPHIAKIARRLMRDAIPQGWILKPKDAIHLATAMWLDKNVENIDELHTYDTGLPKYEAMIGIHICEPHVLQARMRGFNV